MEGIYELSFTDFSVYPDFINNSTKETPSHYKLIINLEKLELCRQVQKMKKKLYEVS